MERGKEIGRAVEEILASYERDGGINYAHGPNLPSQQHIVNIMQMIRKVLFPGYLDDGAVDGTVLPYVTGERVVWVYKHLSEEINRCLCFECRDCNGDERKPECVERSARTAMELIEAFPHLRALLLMDVQAALDGDPAANSTDEVIMAYPSIAAIAVHRVAHFMRQREVPLLPRILSEDIHHRTGIDINPGAVIGTSFFIDHGTGVVIGETAEIGDRVKIYQGVTLGALSVSRDMRGHKRHPTIEDDVTIYAGATILGGDTVIGRGSTIGGNVWLVNSVPPYTKVYNERQPDETVVAQHA